MTNSEALRRLLLLTRGHWRRAGVVMILALVGTGLVLVFPGVVAWFVDEIIPQRRMDEVIQAGALAGGAFALRELLAAIRLRVSAAFEQGLTAELRLRLHRQLERLPVAWFDQTRSGDVLTRMAEDVPTMQRVILEGIEQGLTAVLQIVIVTVMLFWGDWKLALIVLAPTPMIAAGGWIYSRWVSPRAVAAREAASAVNTTLLDTLAGIRQVKSDAAEGLKQEEFRAAGETLRQGQLRLAAAWSIYSPAMTFLGHAGLVTLLVAGAMAVIEGRLELGELMRDVLLIGFLYEPISRLHGVNQTLMQGLAAARRVFAVLEEPEEVDLENGLRPERVEGRVEMREVVFGYEVGRPVLRGCSLEVEPREMVAIVGATGAGKTTIFQLLNRFYEPWSGDLSVDGVALDRWAKRSLRSQVAYVMQEPYLFAGSIRDNLRMAAPDASDEAMWQALEQAHAAEFVRQRSGGLDAEVGERGGRLSGGERQRVALARAFLKDAPLLLLDEATSAVDAESERLIQQALRRLRRDRTCLVIAHRLSTILEADRICVLRDGGVMAQGRHEELLRTCPYYATLARMAGEAERRGSDTGAEV